MVSTFISVSDSRGNALVLGEGGAEFIVRGLPDGRLQISASSNFGTIHSRLDAQCETMLRDYLNARSEQST